MKDLIIQIQGSETGNPVTLNLTGRLCGMDAVQLKSRVAQHMEGLHEDLVIDLTNLNSIDLKGINSLASIYKLQDLKGCEAEFVHHDNSLIMNEIHPTRMDKVLPFRNTAYSIAS